MSDILLRFIHISDTHISADPHYNDDGAMHTPLIGAQSVVHEINHLPFTPDFVLHTGDVAYNPDASAYDTARDVFSALNVPIYYVVGNHDYAEPLQRVMLGRTENVKTPYDDTFEVKGVQIILMDSNRPAPNYCGRVSDEQLAWLDGFCRADDDRPLIVAVHHNVLPMGSPLWDEKMKMVNGEAFHRTLLPARDRLRGVFFGHVHQNTDTLRDGILYTSALSTWYQFHNYPDQVDFEVDRHAGPGYSIVTVTRDQTFIRRYRYTVDAGSLIE